MQVERQGCEQLEGCCLCTIARSATNVGETASQFAAHAVTCCHVLLARRVSKVCPLSPQMPRHLRLVVLDVA